MEIAPNVYQIQTWGTNITLIAEETLTLIDTGPRGSLPKITKFISTLGYSIKDISLIIITHNHTDHTGTLPELKKLTKAKVALHKADAVLNGNELPYPRPVQKLFTTRPFSYLQSLLVVRSDLVDLLLEGGEELSPLGGLKVLHTPGHTRGSICLFSPKRKLLIAGDTLHNRHHKLSFAAKTASMDWRQARESAKKLALLEFDVLCFGHGNAITEAASVKLKELLKSSLL